VLLHAVARFGMKVFLYLRSPYSRDYGEGCILAMVQLLDERGTYFMDLHGYPYVHLNYPPGLSPCSCGPFHRWLGPTLWVPRLLSSLATLGIVAAVYALARRFGHSRGGAAVLAGIALCPWFVQTWGPLARVDMLAIFFSAAGLLAFRRGARLGIVFVLFWLAFFTKQNALLAPAAVLLSIALSGPTAAIRGRPRRLRRAAGHPVRPARPRHPRRGLPSPRHLHRGPPGSNGRGSAKATASCSGSRGRCCWSSCSRSSAIRAP
jgi:hypothetical protein